LTLTGEDSSTCTPELTLRMLHNIHFLRLFFVSKKTIETCKEKVDAFKMREEASNRINSKVYLKEDEVKDMIKCNRIVGSAVHPDTGKIVPFYMRMSGFVIFNMPIVFAVLFTRN